MKLLKLKLDDLGKIGRGKSKHRPRDDKSLYGGDFPFVQTGDVKAANFYLTEYTQTYNEKGLAQSKLWKKGTLLITIAANIGDTAILGIDACFPDSIVGFQSYENISDIKYVKYYLDYIKLELKAISAGTTQDNMSLEKLLSRNLYVHEYPNQVKIASILSSYDELIENNIQRIKLLEEMAEEIYKEWFVRLRFPGYENTKIVDGLPEGWEDAKVENVLKTSSGGTPSRLKEAEYYGGSIDWIKTGELKDTFILNAQETITDIGLKNSSAKLFPSNTLLMAMYGVNIGQLGISVKKSAANQAVCVFNPISGIQFSIYYTFFFFKSMRLHLFNISMGAAQQNLSQDLIKKINILKPKAEIITRYDLIVEPMFAEIKVLTQKNQLLQETRDLLLPRLISGKLSVEHLLDEKEDLLMVAEPNSDYSKSN
jgi:type I restriction enzyme S subunit